tara:strand:- start:8005 stop:8592 length:588 start_codon:yes stop_codon:yes gene_type:complete
MFEMFYEAFEFTIGAMLAYLITRVPFLTFPRVKSWNQQFSPHPEPVFVDGHLIQRVLHMRLFYWLALVFAIIPATFGWLSIAHGSAPIGFGMWVVSGWLILSRVTSVISGEQATWNKQLAMELQIVINKCAGENPCCNLAYPLWEVTCVKCNTCGENLLNQPRPDLGRPRSDGWIAGFFRLLISDGRPIVASEEE